MVSRATVSNWLTSEKLTTRARGGGDLLSGRKVQPRLRGRRTREVCLRASRRLAISSIIEWILELSHGIRKEIARINTAYFSGVGTYLVSLRGRSFVGYCLLQIS